MKVLIVEDNVSISRNISQFLSLKWIDSQIVYTGKEGLYQASYQPFDAMILDIWLPEMDWLEVCKALREKGKNIPILILTSRSTRGDIVTGLEAGADDYLVKPFDYNELVARIKALTRRGLQNKSTTKIYFQDIEIDVENILVKKWELSIHLSALEFNLLKYLLQNEGKIISKEELFERVWGEYDMFKMGKTVDVYIGYLRKKLGSDLIETVKGRGYRVGG